MTGDLSSRGSAKGGHLTTIIVTVIAGLAIAFLSAWAGKVYGAYEITSQTKQFLDDARDLISTEHYQDVRKLADRLPAPVRHDKDVDLVIQRTDVLAAAKEKDVSGIMDRAKLTNLRLDAEVFERHQHAALTIALLGEIDTLRDEPTKAHGEFAEALTRDPSLGSAYNMWGYSLMEWGMGEGSDNWQAAAEKKFRDAIRLSPRDEWPLINLGVLALRKDDLSQADYEAANKYFEMAMKIAPDHPNAYMDSAVCLLSIGVTYQKDNPTEAAEYFGQASAKFKRAEELGMDSPLFHVNWGYLFELNGDKGRAQYHYERALEMEPMFLTACLNRAALLQDRSSPRSEMDSYRQCRNIVEQMTSNFHDRAAATADAHAAMRLREWEARGRERLVSLDTEIDRVR